MKKSVYVVIEHYTPYKHNGCTEDDNITVFAELSQAVNYVRGTTGNDTVLAYVDRVKLDLKDGCKPEYEISVAYNDTITFKVKTECLREQKVELGGYVHRVDIARMPINGTF